MSWVWAHYSRGGGGDSLAAAKRACNVGWEIGESHLCAKNIHYSVVISKSKQIAESHMYVGAGSLDAKSWKYNLTRISNQGRKKLTVSIS